MADMIWTVAKKKGCRTEHECAHTRCPLANKKVSAMDKKMSAVQLGGGAWCGQGFVSMIRKGVK